MKVVRRVTATPQPDGTAICHVEYVDDTGLSEPISGELGTAINAMQVRQDQGRKLIRALVTMADAIQTAGKNYLQPPVNPCPLAGSGAPCFCHWTAPNSPHCVHTPKGS